MKALASERCCREQLEKKARRKLNTQSKGEMGDAFSKVNTAHPPMFYGSLLRCRQFEALRPQDIMLMAAARPGSAAMGQSHSEQ